MKDLYTEIADEFRVERSDVKALAFPLMYSFVAPDNLAESVRDQVRLAIKLGFIRPRAKEKI